MTDKMREQARASYARHREQRMADVREWQRKNAEKRREISRLAAARRKARKLQQFIEDIDMQALILRDEGYCGICGESLPGPDFHIDHIVPLSRGGEHSMRNVQLAHPSCNVRKGAALSL
jgi:5-methylcytosine-specific restriction endonuclease McrA